MSGYVRSPRRRGMGWTGTCGSANVSSAEWAGYAVYCGLPGANLSYPGVAAVGPGAPELATIPPGASLAQIQAIINSPAQQTAQAAQAAALQNQPTAANAVINADPSTLTVNQVLAAGLQNVPAGSAGSAASYIVTQASGSATALAAIGGSAVLNQIASAGMLMAHPDMNLRQLTQQIAAPQTPSGSQSVVASTVTTPQPIAVFSSPTSSDPGPIDFGVSPAVPSGLVGFLTSTFFGIPVWMLAAGGGVLLFAESKK